MEVAGVSNLRLPRWVRVRFLQRAHILANEAAARAGRGQAIAPTMDELLRPLHRRHSRGDGLSSPWSLAKIPRAPRAHTDLAMGEIIVYSGSILIIVFEVTVG